MDFLLMDFNAKDSYPTAMFDENLYYLKTESGQVFTKDMNEDWVIGNTRQRFTRASATLRKRDCNLKDKKLQDIPIKEKQEKQTLIHWEKEV